MSKSAIDFYFDFSSPYGYLAATKIDALAAAHRREVTWRPILLGPAFKVSGNTPLVGQPLKGSYSIRDFQRTAKFLNIPFNIPQPFPIATQNAARAFYWLHDAHPQQAKALAMALFKTYFVDGHDITTPDVVIGVAATIGINCDELSITLASPAAKERLKQEVDASLIRGVFGSPYFIVDGEPFWGSDRLEQIEAWLRTGGW